MEDNHVAFEDHEATTNTHNNDHGWQKVTYAKRQRKTAKPSAAVAANLNKSVANGTLTGADNVFLSLEQDSADCRRRILEAQRSTAVDSDVVSRSKHRINDDDDSSDGEGERVAENGKADESKKVKAKKPKKPKVTVSDAAAKIDADDLSAFLADITVSFAFQFRNW